MSCDKQQENCDCEVEDSAEPDAEEQPSDEDRRQAVNNQIAAFTSSLFSDMVARWVDRKNGVKAMGRDARKGHMEQLMNVAYEAAMIVGEKFLGITVLSRGEVAPVRPLDEDDDLHAPAPR